MPVFDLQTVAAMGALMGQQQLQQQQQQQQQQQLQQQQQAPQSSNPSPSPNLSPTSPLLLQPPPQPQSQSQQLPHAGLYSPGQSLSTTNAGTRDGGDAQMQMQAMLAQSEQPGHPAARRAVQSTDASGRRGQLEARPEISLSSPPNAGGGGGGASTRSRGSPRCESDSGSTHRV